MMVLVVFGECTGSAETIASTPIPSQRAGMSADEEYANSQYLSCCENCQTNCSHILKDEARHELVAGLQQDTVFMNLVCDKINEMTDEEITHAGIDKANQDAKSRGTKVLPGLVKFVKDHSGILAGLIRSACAARLSLIVT
jgi:hypothetical protein